MMDFSAFIDREAKVNANLHADVHRHFALARRDERHRRLWIEACARFRDHVSPLDHWIAAALSGQIEHEPEVQDFALCFLERDPTYFRSGYHKEDLLRYIKRARLSRTARARVEGILLDAVRRRGRREFRRYCRLAAALGSERLRAEVESLTGATDRAMASRAELMLGYLDRHKERES